MAEEEDQHHTEEEVYDHIDDHAVDVNNTKRVLTVAIYLIL